MPGWTAWYGDSYRWLGDHDGVGLRSGIGFVAITGCTSSLEGQLQPTHTPAVGFSGRHGFTVTFCISMHTKLYMSWNFGSSACA